MDLIDIYVPTYEPNPAFLREAIESAKSQTESRWRMLVHDDSSDVINVRSIVDDYINDPRIHFIKSHARLGIGGNWNACLRYGHAPFIQYLFQDDKWAPTYLETMLKTLEANPSVGFASADHSYLCDSEMKATQRYDEVRTIRNQMVTSGMHSGKELLQTWIENELHPNIIGEPSFVMLRRALVHQVGRFDEAMPQFLDSEYWMRCLQRSNYYAVGTNLGAFRVHAKAASARNQESGAGIYDRLNCFERLITTLPNGDLKRKTITARNTALVSMAKKYLARKKEGKATPTSGNVFMKSFAMKHPILMTSALFKAWRD